MMITLLGKNRGKVLVGPRELVSDRSTVCSHFDRRAQLLCDQEALLVASLVVNSASIIQTEGGAVAPSD